MDKAFQNFVWKNEPILETPLNAANLNSINNGLDTVDDRVIVLDTSKANKADLLTDVVNVAYNNTTGVWTFTRRNGTTVKFDQNIEKIPVSFSMSAAGVITMTTADGTTYTADIATLIKLYTFSTTSEIQFVTNTDTSGNKTIRAYIVDGSITSDKLDPDYLAAIVLNVQDAQASRDAAALSANSAAADALLSQSYAVGNTGTRTGEDTDNSKYYKEQCASDGEAWTRGTRGGQAVPNTDETYNNNSKYYSDLANGYQRQAKEYRDQAQQIVGIGIATTTTAGIVMPDGETIDVDNTGKITSIGIPNNQWATIQNRLSL